MTRYFKWEDGLVLTGYSDLPRIWTTAGLYENFYELSRVEEIIRDDIEKYKIPDIDPINLK